MKKGIIVNYVVGSLMLFGTVFLVSRAWKKGQD